MAQTFIIIFTIFFTILLSSSFTVAALRKRKQNNVSDTSTNNSFDFAFPKSANQPRKPPMIPRNTSVVVKDKFNPEIDLFKGKEVKRVGQGNRVTKPLWDGDENEDFHWHDKRRRRPDKLTTDKSHGGQRVAQIVSNEFNT